MKQPFPTRRSSDLHVAKRDIDQLIANQRFQLQQHRVLAEGTDDDLDTGNGIKRQNVERQQLSLGTQQRPRKLTPATGRGTEVDDDLPRTKDLVLFLDFLELDGSAPAKSEATRLLHVGTGPVFSDPPGGAGAAFLPPIHKEQK